MRNRVFFLVYWVGFQFHDMFTGQSEQALQPFFRFPLDDREEIVHNARSFGLESGLQLRDNGD